MSNENCVHIQGKEQLETIYEALLIAAEQWANIEKESEGVAQGRAKVQRVRFETRARNFGRRAGVIS